MGRIRRISRISSLLATSFLLLFGNCNDNKNLVQNDFSDDPYKTSFWGKSVRLLITERNDGDSDTIFFDSAGNMVAFSYSGIIDETATFDQRHRMQSLNKGGDVFDTYYFQYDTFKRNIIQRIMPMIDYKSSFDSTKVDYENVSYVVSVFDENNQGRQKIDFQNRTITDLEYRNGLLTRKHQRYLDTNLSRIEWKYFYEKDCLTRVEKYMDDAVKEKSFFSNGLIDSTIYVRGAGDEYTIKFMIVKY